MFLEVNILLGKRFIVCCENNSAFKDDVYAIIRTFTPYFGAESVSLLGKVRVHLNVYVV